MPSPIGHAVAGAAGGWLAARPDSRWRRGVAQVAWLCAAGVAADLDLLWGRHSRETHSVGAALAAGFTAAALSLPVGTTRSRTFFAVFLAWLTHPLLDVLSEDNAQPIGVMLWWPFSRQFVHAAHPLFDPISRNWTSAAAWLHDFAAAGRECLWLVPIAAGIWVWRSRQQN